MIKTLDHAQEVQTRRFNSGKRGFAKAVRNFVSKTQGGGHRRTLNAMPHTFDRKEESEAA